MRAGFDGLMKTGQVEIQELLDELPEDVSLDDIQYHMYVRQKIQSGLDAVANGRVVPHAEIERRMSRWLDR